MSRLVVVSNRVALMEEGKQAAGGLAVAILAALKKTGGIWFGWSGTVVDGESQAEPTKTEAGKLTYATLDWAAAIMRNITTVSPTRPYGRCSTTAWG